MREIQVRKTKSTLAIALATAVASLFSARAFAQSSTSLQTSIPTQHPSKIKAGWSLGLSGTSFTDEQEQAQTTGLLLNGDLDYRFTQAVELKAAASADLESGYAQSRFGDNTPSSGIVLKEAVVVLRPLDRMSLQAGAVDQGHLHAPLVVASQPFPGVVERVLLGSRAFNVEVKAEQAVPTSKTLSTKAVEAETTPSFTTETLALRGQAGGALELLAYGTHYAYRSLPSTVAAESERYGNTVVPLTSKREEFKYEFDGYILGAGSKIHLGRETKLGLEGQLVQNTKADQSFGAGQLLESKLELGLPGDIDVAPKASYFFTESDVAPGFYNSSEIGHNNRVGWSAGLETVFKRAGFLVGADYVSSDVINPSTLQSRLTYFKIRFETLHELF